MTAVKPKKNHPWTAKADKKKVPMKKKGGC